MPIVISTALSLLVAMILTVGPSKGQRRYKPRETIVLYCAMRQGTARRAGRVAESASVGRLQRSIACHPSRPSLLPQVVFCRMSPLQARLYEFFLTSPPVARALQGRAAARDKASAAAARRAGRGEAGGGRGSRADGEGAAGAAGSGADGREGGGRAPGQGQQGQADLSVLAAITTGRCAATAGCAPLAVCGRPMGDLRPTPLRVVAAGQHTGRARLAAPRQRGLCTEARAVQSCGPHRRC
jgi:hypothetical protein